MSINKKRCYGWITLATIIITQIVIRSIGVHNIPTIMIVIALAIVCILIIIGTYKSRNNGLGVKYNTILAMLVILLCISSGTWITIIKNYPELLPQCDTVLFVVSLISFFSLCIYIVIGRIIYERKYR